MTLAIDRVAGRQRTARPPTRRSSWIHRRDRRGVWFIVPFLAAFGLFMVVPLGYAVYSSLYTSKLIGGTTFSGLANYQQVLTSGDFWSGVVRTVIYAAIQIPVMLVIAFFFAAIFDLGLVKFGKFFRTVFFMPFAVPGVVAAVMWSFMLEPHFGPVTQVLAAFGVQNVDFFGPNLVLPSIILIVIWEWTGYNMVILFTALKQVPRDMVEAALLDGATVWTIIRRVKLPMVRPAIVMIVLVNTIGALQLFTEPFILQQFENQAISTNYTPTLYVFNTATGGGQYNLAAAMAVILGLFIGVVSVGSLLFRRRAGDLG
ncbi:MAG TPA: sugar ABC transporter permease [Pseudonocardiaceae bacterium]|nr:sugar ABC transporter permease [Pseudonocardiaceae bacterium]